MTDEELIIKYRKYKRKRNLIILVSFLFILFIVSLIKINTNDKQNIPVEEPQEEQEKLDLVAPILTLNKDSIEITEGDEIDYKSYIESAIDDVDGDITNKVLYFEIDTTKVGENIITYYVLDSSNNMSKKELKVIIKEQEKELPETNNKPVEEAKPNNNINSNTSSNEPQNKSEIKEKITKYFLFSDGYTMSDVVDACANELKKIGVAGTCTPLTDSNGIYLGMKLETN